MFFFLGGVSHQLLLKPENSECYTVSRLAFSSSAELKTDEIESFFFLRETEKKKKKKKKMSDKIYYLAKDWDNCEKVVKNDKFRDQFLDKLKNDEHFRTVTLGCT